MRLGNGEFVAQDGVTYASSNTAAASGKNLCKKRGWKTFSDPSFKNQGQCVSAMNHTAMAGKGKGDDNSQGNDNKGNNKGNNEGDGKSS